MVRGLSEATGPIAALDDDLRRRMYLYIRGRGAPVSRDEAASQVGISRKLAAFHLDKLLAQGLLRASYARPSGRSGPGAGRTSKLYEPSDLEVSVSIPERRYEVVGGVLVDAIAGTPEGAQAASAALRVAGERGTELGAATRAAMHLRPPGIERTLAVADQELAEMGFEPVREERELWLRNCPYAVLAKQAPELVCALNRAYLDGFLKGLGNRTLEAALDPGDGRCCVRLRPRAATRPRDRA
jgi:predicted ArsR family transcriptional regulator